ncbi:hypothetical protein AAH979_00045 [Plantactinospora sp. ZYX-F-223]|uniref:hypothetical protein n=1 Tax=Plantactinospora sp. ZYX-F-223 TaxID=3144103 RepID=UPI0031FE20EC
METATWRVVGRAFPGPVGWAVWIMVTVPAPLVFHEWSHRWEEDQAVSTALWWTVGALPVLSAVAAAKWARYARQRGSAAALVTAVAVAMLVAAVFLGASIAVYRWVIPLNGTAGWSSVLVSGAGLATCGAAVGHLVGPKLVRRRLSDPHGYLVGGIVAVLGILLAPMTVRLGAEGSTVRYDVNGYGGVGPYSASAGEPGELTLPAAGRYGIYAVGFAPRDPACRVAGAGLPARSAELLTIPPGDYGGDAASYTWVAVFDVPGPATYSLTCRSSDEQASYTVGYVPQIRGAVAALIHWPVVAIWFLGAVPGLLIVAGAVTRRARRPSGPVLARPR